MDRRLQTALVQVTGLELVDADLGAPRAAGARRASAAVGSTGSVAVIRAGAPSVFQISWKNTPSSGRPRLTGTGPSDSTTETPSAVCPVTTRRGGAVFMGGGSCV